MTSNDDKRTRDEMLAEIALLRSRIAALEGKGRSEHEVDWDVLFHQLTAVADHVIWFMGVVPERMLYVSPAFEQIWGRTADELYEDARLWAKCIHEDDVPAVLAQFEDLVAGRIPTFSATYRVVRPDGGVRWVEDTGAALFAEDGSVYRLTGMVKDVTRRKLAEAEHQALADRIQQAQKIESLGVLAGGVAHDFNNLLVGILGNADLALLDLPPESPARPRLEGVELAARRAADLARQMLAYSGKGRFVVTRLDLRKLFEEIAHLLEVSISKKAVLKYRFADQMPAIEGDATQIRQVVMNLITNASESIGDNSGVISISTGAMECDRSYLAETYLDDDLEPGVFAFIEVSDTGCGMDDETQRCIFDPFFTTKFAGRGLGLAAALGIVKGHKGALKVYSEPGTGTTFKILFPAIGEVAADQPERSAPGEEAPCSGTILLVDDEETIRLVGEAMLRRGGFDVITAPDGRSALDVFTERAADIDCVLLDLAMPNMDGEETYRELRRVAPGVKVLLSSGYNEQDAINRFSGKNLAGFIQKPYRSADLLEAVRKVLA